MSCRTKLSVALADAVDRRKLPYNIDMIGNIENLCGGLFIWLKSRPLFNFPKKVLTNRNFCVTMTARGGNLNEKERQKIFEKEK